ncbi:DUF6461 domain-containing protein [Streptomyces niveiscabiei]|uniref:DUF6461 domain-containing protein n=1 Tax=Streptomyces niveiscabiei TaxID=164115 RepID=UPI0029AF4F6C|nr:DUF6461 domain-containing protein [Streptomyces niveiscabiei]MDX3382677.1 DUF6461 domain-containing protein [Streptomyces niveiscabiei]
MTDGITWLQDYDGRLTALLFAKGVSPEELAARMGGEPLPEPATELEVDDLLAEPYREDGYGDAAIRVGTYGSWTLAVEYGDSPAGDLLAELSRDGVELVRYCPAQEHPPALFDHAFDGVHLCGHGLTEELWRWGDQPDLLVPELAAAGILTADGGTYLPADGERHRSLVFLERRFGLSLSPAYLQDARLPVHALPRLSG